MAVNNPAGYSAATTDKVGEYGVPDSSDGKIDSFIARVNGRSARC